MAYDLHLADRIRHLIGPLDGVSERKMFGGIAFMQYGRMFCGIVDDQLMARVGADRYEQALALPHVRPMDFTGRPMIGYVFVGPHAIRTQPELSRWIEWTRQFVATLPAKKPKKAKPMRLMKKPVTKRAR